MNPKDFLSIARRIIESRYREREAVMRTVVSRAYYSSFLVCKEFAIDQGEIDLRRYDRNDFPRKGEVHSAVREALMNVHLGHIASMLLDLFDRRVVADYKIAEIVQREDAEESIQLSEKIEKQIDLFR